MENRGRGIIQKPMELGDKVTSLICNGCVIQS
uniref:Uncharacterized protein n=1 Tax=Anguilla anguilla TaxID=7936 RepID=A0A0E9T8C0_ANGAN